MNMNHIMPSSDAKPYSEVRENQIILTLFPFQNTKMLNHWPGSIFSRSCYSSIMANQHKSRAIIMSSTDATILNAIQNPYVAPFTCSLVRHEPKKPQPTVKRQMTNSNSAEDSVGPR